MNAPKWCIIRAALNPPETILEAFVSIFKDAIEKVARDMAGTVSAFVALEFSRAEYRRAAHPTFHLGEYAWQRQPQKFYKWLKTTKSNSLISVLPIRAAKSST
ncbi:MAG: hypothetical protein V4463_14890 [Pseudomonadota bacterium]